MKWNLQTRKLVEDGDLPATYDGNVITFGQLGVTYYHRNPVRALQMNAPFEVDGVTYPAGHFLVEDDWHRVGVSPEEFKRLYREPSAL